GKGAQESADIWSLGITIIEFALGNPPYFDVNPMKSLFLITKNPSPNLPENNESWSPLIRDFISQCLAKEPDDRPTAEMLLEHEFVKNAGDKTVLAKTIEEILGFKSVRLSRP